MLRVSGFLTPSRLSNFSAAASVVGARCQWSTSLEREILSSAASASPKNCQVSKALQVCHAKNLRKFVRFSLKKV
jgi:hypothetical protein